jgi:ketosteroid isomerase-like protein
MSENLELVRSIYADWERGDFFGSTDWLDPEIEFVAIDGSEVGSYTGLAEMGKTVRDRLDVWEDVRLKPEEYRELDDERVLVIYSMSGRGQTSGLEVARMPARAVLLFHVRAGKITRLVLYFDRDRALADLGLKE